MVALTIKTIDAPDTHIPPSQQPAQYPVPKGGEPLRPTKGILAVVTVEPEPSKAIEAQGPKAPAPRKGDD